MLGTKLYKNSKNDMAKYTATAVWCNANNAHIDDVGEYYEVVENVVHVPTLQEKIEQLSADYESARFEIGKYYMEAVLDGNVDVQKELQSELVALKKQYDTDVAELEAEAE